MIEFKDAKSSSSAEARLSAALRVSIPEAMAR
jgi:hypothetical protein